MSLVVHNKETPSLFHLLLRVVSGSFQPVLAYYGLFRFASFFMSDDVTECFDLQIYYKSTSCRFYYKVRQALLQNGAALMYCITKYGNFYYKVGQLFCIAKPDKWYYKVGQLLLQSGAAI